MAALRVSDSMDRTAIVEDFNAVSWETTFRRMMRVGKLIDPRIGRGFFSTYDAEKPIIAWPLDHILIQSGIGVVGFRKLPSIGSDHYPAMALV
ncbi:endonuclease/exonuclease/phosphatase family protein [Fulvimarina sp. MAC8]|uniref:endonuclease/exonuclease/phosphatase family protein n=1 Tax=Fulvimarina sp. MAC8 TaxID=3162874 RepID=UPI0032EB0810